MRIAKSLNSNCRSHSYCTSTIDATFALFPRIHEYEHMDASWVSKNGITSTPFSSFQRWAIRVYACRFAVRGPPQWPLLDRVKSRLLSVCISTRGKDTTTSVRLRR